MCMRFDDLLLYADTTVHPHRQVSSGDAVVKQYGDMVLDTRYGVKRSARASPIFCNTR